MLRNYATPVRMGIVSFMQCEFPRKVTSDYQGNQIKKNLATTCHTVCVWRNIFHVFTPFIWVYSELQVRNVMMWILLFCCICWYHVKRNLWKTSLVTTITIVLWEGNKTVWLCPKHVCQLVQWCKWTSQAVDALTRKALKNIWNDQCWLSLAEASRSQGWRKYDRAMQHFVPFSGNFGYKFEGTHATSMMRWER